MERTTSSREPCSHGIVRRDHGDLDGALSDFDWALRADPDRAEAWNNRGATRFARGDLEGALADFDQALGRCPGYAEAHNNRGIARHRLGDHRGALADFDRALELRPRYAEALLNRGHTRLILNDLTGALADLDRAIGIRPDCAEAYHGRAAALRAWGDPAGALADYDRLLALLPPRALAPIHHLRAGVLFEQKRFAEAAAACTQALEIEPDFCTAYLSRGNARYHLRDRGAAADYELAFDLDPQAAAAEVVRILREDLQRDVEEVLENCRKHLRINPDDGMARARRGLTLLLLGRDAEAAPDLEELLRWRPDWEGALALVIAAAREQRDDLHAKGPEAPALKN
jgi:tetratricopeptide (TPR) repeat protein